MAAILYRGPSLIDGAPIVAVATGHRGSAPSDNPKTGPMLQTWILPADRHPNDARRSGADRSVCGDCPIRSGCYVTGRTLASVARSVARAFDATDHATRRALGTGDAIRLGAYGDPAAVPAAVWWSLVDRARMWTGYSHQWRAGMADPDLVMASVESPTQGREAAAFGMRPFLVTETDAPRLDGYAVCPNTASGGAIRCIDCGLCQPGAAKVGVQNPAHGTRVRDALVSIRRANRSAVPA